MKIDFDKIIVSVFISFLLVKAFAGPIGIYFHVMNYFPVIAMLILIGIRWIKLTLTKINYVFFAIFLSLYILIGIYYNSLLQSVFGIYIFIPFLFGFIFCDNLYESLINKGLKFYILIYVATAIGIIYVQYFNAPWLGSVLSVGGVDKVVSRAWTAGGVLRNPGFTGASFDAATLLLISSFFINNFFLSRRNYIFVIFFTSVSLYLVNITTTKTTMVTIVLVVLLMSLKRKYSINAVKIMMLICIIFSYLYMIPPVTVQNLYTGSNTLLLRMYQTWPAAMDLLETPSAIIIGKGFGSIGTPQAFFSPLDYNPADNVLVYLYIIFGSLSIIATIFFLIRFLFAKFYISNQRKTVYIFSACILLGGVTYNLFESVFYAPYAGILIAIFYNKNICYLSSRKLI